MSSTEDDDLDAPQNMRNPQHNAKLSSAVDEDAETESDTDHERPIKRHKHNEEHPVQLKWSDEDGEDVGAAAYKKFMARKPEARKRAVKSTRKAKAVEAQRQARVAEGHTGVGIQRVGKPPKRRIAKYDDVSSDEEFMEWTMPDYIQNRRAQFNSRIEQLREGGLSLPPEYSNIDFSEDDDLEHIKERPQFSDIKPSAPYKDIDLPYSRGVIPASIAQYLREYQVKGVSFLHETFVYQRGAILGDDMGLGKTIQVIAFLTAAYGKTGDERDDKRMRKMRNKDRWYPKTLIICPGSLMANWQDEFSRWGWWHVSLYHGNNKQEVLEAAAAGMIEVMITTYSTYQMNRGEINMVKWDCVVADECHQVKNRKAEVTIAMNEVNSLCRIGLTGTAIQNKYEELWTLLNWTSPGQLGPLSTWKVSVSEPLKLGQSHNATVYELATARKTAKKLVQNLLPRFFLRRMKTLIKDQLPKKTDRVVFCPLTPTQADAYQNFLDSEIVRMIRNSGEMCECGSGKKSGWCCHTNLEDGTAWQNWVFPALATLQKLSNHLALIIPSGIDTKDKQAKDLDILQTAMPDQWKKLFATRDNILNSSNPEFCGKWRILKKLLKFWHDQGGNKVLIFSHSVRLLKMLHDLFMSSSYNVKFLDGSMKYEDRFEAVKEFNTDPTQFVFLISTRAGGVGLNITSANKVVVVDPNWNPSYDLQAQDRAYRIGQTKDVEVFRLVSQGTLEEIVYARQIYKQQQANIGYNATEERRYFQGVQDRKEKKGEIFGLQNLFAYEHENVVLRDIVNKTNVAESRADIRVANLELEDDLNSSHGDENDEDHHAETKSIKTEEDRADTAMSQLAAEIKGEFDKLNKRRSKAQTAASSFRSDASETKTRHDPVQAILLSAGVTYTHENSEVIGSSRVEAQLSKRAEEADTNTQQQLSKVFIDDSQSQSQQLRPLHQHPDNTDLQSRNYANGTTYPGEIRYKYKPPTDVKRRQFCSMASWAGHATTLRGIEEFATRVESWTQAQRREFLEAFYADRRQKLEQDEDVDGKLEMKNVVKCEVQNKAKSENTSEADVVETKFRVKPEPVREVVVLDSEDDEL